MDGSRAVGRTRFPDLLCWCQWLSNMVQNPLMSAIWGSKCSILSSGSLALKGFVLPTEIHVSRRTWLVSGDPPDVCFNRWKKSRQRCTGWKLSLLWRAERGCRSFTLNPVELSRLHNFPATAWWLGPLTFETFRLESKALSWFSKKLKAMFEHCFSIKGRWWCDLICGNRAE